MQIDYLPSNGAEGLFFETMWCERCIKCPIDPAAKNQCRYLLIALSGEFNGKWIARDGKNPVCTAFKSRRKANKQRKEAYSKRVKCMKKDTNQLELF